MWFNRFLSFFLIGKHGVKHWWRETVDANVFEIIVTVRNPDNSRTHKWVGIIRLNGEMSLRAQSQVMRRLCWSLDIKG